MASIRNRKDVENWLRGKPVAVSRVIAFRAAARVLPAAARLLTTDIRAWSPDRVAAAIILPQLRAAAFAAVASLAPTAAKDPRFAAAADAAADAARAVADARADADADVAAYFAASAPTAAARAAAAAAYADDAAAAVADDDAWRAIESDCAALDGGTSPQVLATSKLWPEDAPEWFARDLAVLKGELLAQGDHWSVWTRWIDRVVAGHYDIDLETRRVLRPTRADWEHKSNPEHINRLLQEIEDERAGVGEVEAGVDTPPAPRKKPAPRKPESRAQPKTARGELILTNAPAILVQAALMLHSFDAAIAELESERPNSPEKKAERDGALKALCGQRQTLVDMMNSSAAFSQGTGSEQKAVTASNRFLKAFSKFWDDQGPTVVGQTVGVALLASGFGLATAFGVRLNPSVCSLAISSVVAADPLAKLIKAGKGIFKGGAGS